VKMNMWVEPAELSKAERVKGYGYVLERKKENMSKESAKLAKVEKKLGVIINPGKVSTCRTKSFTASRKWVRETPRIGNRVEKEGEEGVVGHRRVHHPSLQLTAETRNVDLQSDKL